MRNKLKLILSKCGVLKLLTLIKLYSPTTLIISMTSKITHYIYYLKAKKYYKGKIKQCKELSDDGIWVLKNPLQLNGIILMLLLIKYFLLGIHQQPQPTHKLFLIHLRECRT